MKLKDLITDFISLNDMSKDNPFGIMDGTIYGQALEPLKEKILQCEEFSECTELIISHHPVLTDSEGKGKVHLNCRLNNGQKFKGKCYLLSLALTPEMYDPNKIHEPVLDGVCITPVIYDHITFEPKKKIVIEFSPKNGDVDELRERFNRVLENPENYQAKGDKQVLVRGLFETVESNEGVETNFLVGIEHEKETLKTIFYLEIDEEFSADGEVKMALSKTFIPIELCDEFIEELGEKGLHVTKEEIDNFLERHNHKQN